MASTSKGRLMVLLFTDIAGSVDLKTRFGNLVYQKLISRHDRFFREIVGAIQGGEILKDTGDGFLARFATASDGVNNTSGTELLGEFGILWIVLVLRFVFGIEVVEIAKKLIKTMIGGQMFIKIT